MPNENELREQICETGRRMYQCGMVAGRDGNISCRLAGGRFLGTPTGISKGFMESDDLVVVDGEGNVLAGKRERTSEIFLHLEIYRNLPGVMAVVHAHPPHATAFAIAHIAPPLNVMPEMDIAIGPVPIAQYDTPGTKQYAKTVTPHLVDGCNTILLANHGAVAFDENLTQAMFHLESIERYCQILLLTKQVGKICPIPPDKAAELDRIRNSLDVARFGSKLPASKPSPDNTFLDRHCS